MKFLLVCKQARNAAALRGTVSALAARGHAVAIAIQEHDDSRDARLAAEIGSERCAVVRCPAVRVDAWAEVATLLRRLRDGTQYLRSSMRSAEKLHARVLRTVLEDLPVPPLPTRRFEAKLRYASGVIATSSQP